MSRIKQLYWVPLFGLLIGCASDPPPEVVVETPEQAEEVPVTAPAPKSEEEFDYAEEQLIYQQNASYEKEAWVVKGPMVIFFHPDTATREKKIKRWGQTKFYDRADKAVQAVGTGVQKAMSGKIEFVDTYAKNFAFVAGKDTVLWKRPWERNPWGAYMYNGVVPPRKAELENIEQEIVNYFGLEY